MNACMGKMVKHGHVDCMFAERNRLLIAGIHIINQQKIEAGGSKIIECATDELAVGQGVNQSAQLFGQCGANLRPMIDPLLRSFA